MKLKNFKHFEKYDSPEDDESFYHDDEYLFGRPYHSKKNDEEEGDEEYDHDEEEYETDSSDFENEDMQHLLYLLRSMFRNSGIEDFEIENKNLDITISCSLRRRERLKDIIKIFEIANKLKRDILAQYDSEFEMWETKMGDPILVFNFLYEEGLYDDNKPF